MLFIWPVLPDAFLFFHSAAAETTATEQDPTALAQGTYSHFPLNPVQTTHPAISQH